MANLINWMTGAIFVAAGAVSLGWGSGVMWRAWQAQAAINSHPYSSMSFRTIEEGKTYPIRNGTMTSIVQRENPSSPAKWYAMVLDGSNATSAQWDENGKCIGGPGNYEDLSRFDIVLEK